ncbi:hypothetical protein [Paracoccus fontiphilus]|uniref:hypothetical protein n=1 Tax=Paracoccus fontiphilus TaxID=1815556 RepID=UPI001A9657AA|nr:hypothetical protein [Paracoccus fontiphilus]
MAMWLSFCLYQADVGEASPARKTNKNGRARSAAVQVPVGSVGSGCTNGPAHHRTCGAGNDGAAKAAGCGAFGCIVSAGSQSENHATQKTCGQYSHRIIPYERQVLPSFRKARRR